MLFQRYVKTAGFCKLLIPIRVALKVRIRKNIGSNRDSLSSTQKSHSFSAPKIPQFNTKNPSVQHTLQFNTKKPSVQHRKKLCWTEGFLVLNSGMCWTEGFSVLTAGFFVVNSGVFWCWTQGFRWLKRCGPCVELMCWTEGGVELRGTVPGYSVESYLAARRRNLTHLVWKGSVGKTERWVILSQANQRFEFYNA